MRAMVGMTMCNSMAVPCVRWIMDRIRISYEQHAAQWSGTAQEERHG